MGFLIFFIIIPSIILYTLYRVLIWSFDSIKSLEKKTESIGLTALDLVKETPEYISSSPKFISVSEYNNNKSSIIDPKELSKTQRIIVEEPSFNVNSIVEYKGDKPQKFIYRPQTLEEYIGQENAKKKVRLNLKKIHQYKPVHFLISGLRGCGKTSLAYIIRNSLGTEMIERVAGEIQNAEQIITILNEINQKECKYPILFIDEIHSLKPALCEVFYPVMEDFKVSGKRIKPFIMIGATTEKNILMTKVAPMVDRFHVQIDLEQYTNSDIESILRQYKKQLYEKEEMDDKVFGLIAENCKVTPRIALSMLDDCLVASSVKEVLECHRIKTLGLTDVDIKILQILNENNKPIGANALSQILGISLADYSSLYEGYLAMNGFIIRTQRGRIISEKGKIFLNNYKREVK